MQWPKFSEDGTSPHGEAQTWAVWEVEERLVSGAKLALVSEAPVALQARWLVDLAAWGSEAVAEVLPLLHHLQIGHGAVSSTDRLLSSPAVQCSKAGRVTNAKARIQI